MEASLMAKLKKAYRTQYRHTLTPLVPDPTEGSIDANALPQPLVVPDDRNHDHSPCPRGGHLASRPKSGQRTWHDLGD
jgi:hypothetical protein